MFGIQIPSLHVFSDEDKVVTMQSSIEAMTLYHFPKMIGQSSDSHDPPSNEDTINDISNRIHQIWKQKYSMNDTFQLED